jgi:hypothetical protein
MPLPQISSTNRATWPPTMMIPRSPPGRGMRSAISRDRGHALGEFEDHGREERGLRRQRLRIQRDLR